MDTAQTIIEPTNPVPTPTVEKDSLRKKVKQVYLIFIAALIVLSIFSYFMGYYSGTSFLSYPSQAQKAPLGPINPNLKAQQEQAKQITQTLSMLTYWRIPQTNLEVKLPAGSLINPAEQTPSFTPNDKIKILYHYKSKENNPWDVTISSIDTATSAANWVLDNTNYQGSTLREWITNYGKSQPKAIVINNFPFLSIETACCGGYEQVYVLDYSFNGVHELLMFSTRTGFGQVWTDSSYNTVLDSILQSLKQVNSGG